MAKYRNLLREHADGSVELHLVELWDLDDPPVRRVDDVMPAAQKIEQWSLWTAATNEAAESGLSRTATCTRIQYVERPNGLAHALREWIAMSEDEGAGFAAFIRGAGTEYGQLWLAESSRASHPKAWCRAVASEVASAVENGRGRHDRIPTMLLPKFGRSVVKDSDDPVRVRRLLQRSGRVALALLEACPPFLQTLEQAAALTEATTRRNAVAKLFAEHLSGVMQSGPIQEVVSAGAAFEVLLESDQDGSNARDVYPYFITLQRAMTAERIAEGVMLDHLGARGGSLWREANEARIGTPGFDTYGDLVREGRTRFAEGDFTAARELALRALMIRPIASEANELMVDVKTRASRQNPSAGESPTM